MSNKRDGQFWIRAWSPVALAAILVSITSTPYFGADRTNGPLHEIWLAVFGPVSPAHWTELVIAFRKTCHFVGYGFIGLTWLRAWSLTFPRFRFLSDTILAVLGTSVLASCDEFHQSFIPNRTGSPWDVLIDSFGALAICLFAYLIANRSRLLRTRRMVPHSSF